MSATILVLGGSGNFGARIAEVLAREPGVRILIGGRDGKRATEIAKRIGDNAAPAVLDYHDPEFANHLRSLCVNVVINTAGPFQHQDYSAARACISAACHNVDIADGRDFVTGIGALNADAIANDVIVVAGASSVPALSSAVVNRYRNRFAQILEIDHAITAGAKPPGIAALQAVLAYAGKPFLRWQDGAWRSVYGWQDARWSRFGALGRRWLMNCDVPDLQLFPNEYPGVRSVIFRAGTGMAIGTLVLWALSWSVRLHAIRKLEHIAPWLHRLAKAVEWVGTRRSGMRVTVRGLDQSRRPLEVTWTLVADDNHGPYVPCAPAIALTKKLIRRPMMERGAMPCIGVLSVEEILEACAGLKVSVFEE